MTLPFTIPKWIKVAALAILIGAVAGYLALARFKIDSLEAQLDAKKTELSVSEERADGYLILLSERDKLIDKQNAGISALAVAATQNREVYLHQYAAADTRAAGNDARAAEIMRLPNEHLDELAECRAARLLLEEELTR